MSKQRDLLEHMNDISTKETFPLSYTGIRTRDTCLEGKDANRYTMYDNRNSFEELGHVPDDKSLVMLFCCALVCSKRHAVIVHGPWDMYVVLMHTRVATNTGRHCSGCKLELSHIQQTGRVWGQRITAHNNTSVVRSMQVVDEHAQQPQQHRR